MHLMESALTEINLFLPIDIILYIYEICIAEKQYLSYIKCTCP